MINTQQKRLWFQAGFFILFLLAPVFDLFRFDLNVKHFFFLGINWTLGLDDFLAERIDATQAALNIVLRGGLPILGVIGTGIWISWKYGRLYCGWLCPHFSVVETINGVLRRAIGKQSIWDKHPLPERNADGSITKANPLYWLVVVPLALAFAFTWAVALLTYLLPPAEIYGNLWHGELTGNQARFIGVGTLAVLHRIHVRAPPVLPLRLRRRPVPVAGLDGQPQGDGDRLRPQARRILCRLQRRLRQRLPDAHQAPLDQAPHVHLHPVRPVRQCLFPGTGRQPAGARC